MNDETTNDSTSAACGASGLSVELDRLARSAGADIEFGRPVLRGDAIQKFAALVAGLEREECAKSVIDLWVRDCEATADDYAAVIRERSN